MAEPGGEQAGAASPDAGLRRKLIWLTFFRLLFVTVLLGGTALVNLRTGEEGSRTLGPLYLLVLATYLASLGFAVWLRADRALRRLAFAQIALDVAVSGAVVAYTGYSESVFVPLYSLGIVNGSILLYRRGAVTALVLTLATYAGVEALGHPARGGVAWLTVFVHSGALAATAALAGYLSELLRHTGERLAARESDLAALTALQHAIVASMPSGLLTIDAAGRITFLNPAGEQMTGLALRDLYGRPAATWFRAFQAGTSRGEAELPGPDGTRLRCGYSSFPLAGPGGGDLGQAVIFQDLTALRLMEEKVARAERLADLGRLSAGLAHELRNPLASMVGSAELLGASAGLAEEDRRLLSIVQREGGRLAQLVSSFLEYARPAPPRRDPVDLAAVVGETLDALAHDRGAAEVTVERDLRAAAAAGDADQLRQVVWNLVINAVQAAGRGPAGPRGRVRVTVAAPPGGPVELTVEDDGPGIAPGDLERLFTPFFTTKPDGTGLGLATVHRIVEAHGGTVSAGAAGARGARFTVRLPAAPG